MPLVITLVYVKMIANQNLSKNMFKKIPQICHFYTFGCQILVCCVKPICNFLLYLADTRYVFHSVFLHLTEKNQKQLNSIIFWKSRWCVFVELNKNLKNLTHHFIGIKMIFFSEIPLEIHYVCLTTQKNIFTFERFDVDKSTKKNGSLIQDCDEFFFSQNKPPFWFFGLATLILFYYSIRTTFPSAVWL
jgi:hypothetical protein